MVLLVCSGERGVLLVVYNFTVVVEGLVVLCAACRFFVFGNIWGCLSDIYGVACRLHAFGDMEEGVELWHV